MYSFTSSSISAPEKYDVFISFRGEDTRNNFTSHLYAALCQKKIETFIDYRLVRGDEISQALVDAIQESKISIVVFSKQYASSGWCLEELVQILKCKKKSGQIVIPVFYQVDPTNVRKQTGTFEDAFLEHAKYEERAGKLQTWRTALTETANLSGFNSAVISPESVLVKEIVKYVLKRLNVSQSDYIDLVGVNSIINEIESFLCIESVQVPVCSVGLWGIGGIGKTSLADAVFSQICSQFEVSYFIQSVREISDESGGLVRLQEKLLSVILEDKNLLIGSHHVKTIFTRKRLRCKKVFIVFDDVTDPVQIQTLVGGLDFGRGSRFIITTRDKQVLRNWRVDKIYEVRGLLYSEALQLFSRYAFKDNNPEVEYMELSKEVVSYANGVPLALKVLGSFLIGRTERDWKSALKKIKEIPHEDIQKVLKISYDGLNDKVKTIFLDIACFFKWKDRDHVINVLDACGLFTDIGLSVLIDKSLIVMEGNMITMHDLLQEMGREIVRQESNDLGKRSRLWHHEDIYHMLTTNTGTKAIEGICSDTSEMKEIRLTPHAFKKMHNLRLLKLYTPSHQENQNEVLQYLEFSSTRLSYFHWIRCPSKSLGSNFHPECLVELYMPHSKLVQLWNGVKCLVKLKHIDLSDSKYLTRCPDLSLATNLETLILRGCTDLVEIPSSIPVSLLTKFDLSGCPNLKTFPEMSFILEDVDSDETAQSSSIRLADELRYLEALNFFEVKRIAMREEVPLSMRHCLCSLTELNLTNSGIIELPSSLGWLYTLKKLHLGGNNFVNVPQSIVDLDKLDYLNLSHCRRLQSIPELPRNLKCLKAQCCTSLEVLSGLPFIFVSMRMGIAMSDFWKFDFFGCLKLDAKALSYIVKTAILKIQLMGTAWFDEYHTKIRPRARISVPGREIPEWFNFQSTGNSITFDLPHNGDRKFGCVVCIAAVFQEYRGYTRELRASIECDINGKYVYQSRVCIDSNELNHGVYDFFLLGHPDYHDVYRDDCSNEISFEFRIEGKGSVPSEEETKCGVRSDEKIKDGPRMKTFGVHLVYHQDFAEPMKELNGSFDFQSCWGGRGCEDHLIGDVLKKSRRNIKEVEDNSLDMDYGASSDDDSSSSEREADVNIVSLAMSWNKIGATLKKWKTTLLAKYSEQRSIRIDSEGRSSSDMDYDASRDDDSSSSQ